MSNAATLYVLRATLYIQMQSLKGADAKEFWKLLDELMVVRSQYDPDYKAKEFAEKAVEQLVEEVAVGGVLPSTVEPASPANVQRLLCPRCIELRSSHVSIIRTGGGKVLLCPTSVFAFPDEEDEEG